MGGLSESAQQLIRESHHPAGNHNTWGDAAVIGTHLVDAVAIAVQRFIGMALQRSQWKERVVALGAEAATMTEMSLIAQNLQTGVSAYAQAYGDL